MTREFYEKVRKRGAEKLSERLLNLDRERLWVPGSHEQAGVGAAAFSANSPRTISPLIPHTHYPQISVCDRANFVRN